MSTTKKASRRKPIAIALLAIVIAAAAAAGWAWSIASSARQGGAARVYIPGGADSRAVADSLASALGPDLGAKAAMIWGWMGGTPQKAHGSYLVKDGDRAIDVARRLKNGMQTPVRVTFNNLRTIDQLALRLSQQIEATPMQLMDACSSELPALGYDQPNQPAAFLPDTYEFYWTAKPETVVKRIAASTQRFWNDERRAKAAALGLTPNQVATLASIVEEETAKADELPKVARLYLNRLARGMPLQADPTVKFAVGDFSLRRILNKHLEADSPYNTYKHAGLPPGPIRLPSKAGIDAVLNAPAHNYIYMCAKDDFSGYHNFASTLAAHNENARRYHQALNKRGI